MKIKLERDKCISCGSCQALCPKYFEISDDSKSHIKGVDSPQEGSDVEELDVQKIECAESAAEACPAQCIHIIKKSSSNDQAISKN